MLSLLKMTYLALSKADRISFIFAAVGKIAMSILDVLGVVVLGLSVALLSGAKILESSTTGTLLSFLGFKPNDVSLVDFGILSLFFFLFKVVITLAGTKIIGNWLSSLETKYAGIAFRNWLTKLGSNYSHSEVSEIQRTLIHSIQKVFGVGLYFYTVAIGETAIILAIATLLAFVNPLYFLILLSFLICVFALSIILTFPKIKKSAKTHEKANLQALDTISGASSLKKEIYFSQKFEFWIDKFLKTRFTISRSEMDLQRYGTYPRHIVETSLMAGAALLLVLIGASEPDATKLVTITVFVAATFRIFASILPLQGALTAIRQVVESAERALNAISQDSNSMHAPIYKGGANEWELEAINLGFKFDDTKKFLFENLNFKLKAGKQLLIEGKSGVGKSTFLNLLLGLDGPTVGQLSIRGIPATKWSHASSRKIALVSQSPNIFSGTLLENLTFEDQGTVNLNRLHEAIKFVGLDEWVRKLEFGLDTTLSDSVIPSSGQLQLIGLARAIYQDAEILVLDEPLNSLDYQTARRVAQCINRLSGEVTVVIVSHIHTELLNWDMRILLLTNSKVSVEHHD